LTASIIRQAVVARRMKTLDAVEAILQSDDQAAVR
jgi:hypothetical protein